MTRKYTSQQSAAQKEVMLLWIMMTASSKYDPTGLSSAADIVDGISQEMQPLSKGWNWPNLTRGNALQFALRAFPDVAANQEEEEGEESTGTISDEFSDIIDAFQSGNSAASGGGAPWPPDGTHPGVAEVAANLGLINTAN
jgi:hypothetical protein